MDHTTIAMAAWEIGHTSTPYGIRVGGMGLVVEELPGEMLRCYTHSKPLKILVCSPCFRFYDQKKFQLLETIAEPRFGLSFDVFSHHFEQEQGIEHLYFWNESILGDFGERDPSQSIYPADDWKAIRTYARISAAIAAYLMKHGCNAIHLHDYHLGLIPFYINWEAMGKPSIVLTIHNGSYQGWHHLWGDPSPVMYELSMPSNYYERYFQYWGDLNVLKGILLYLPQVQGRVTTVSENYARELTMDDGKIRAEARKKRLPEPRKVFIPNLTLSELAWFQPPIVGINNGLAAQHNANSEPAFQAAFLKAEKTRVNRSLFEKEEVAQALMGCPCQGPCEHQFNYSVNDYTNRHKLRQLMYLECFGKFPEPQDLCICFMGRLDPQKNLEVIRDAIRYFDWNKHPNVHFAVQVTAPKPGTNRYGESLCDEFRSLHQGLKEHFYFYEKFFSYPLSKLLQAGSDFCLVPSRFEPCGLVDYEAAVLGCIPIVRETGGLKKTMPYCLSYAWYDEEDRANEVWELLKVIERGIDLWDISAQDLMQLRVYSDLTKVKDLEITRRIKGCMSLDTSWSKAVAQYFELFGI